MVLISMADGDIDDSEVKMISSIYGKIAGQELDEKSILEEALSAKKEGLSVTDYLLTVSPFLNDSGKERIIRAAFFVAAADGEFHDEEVKLLEEMAGALEISQAHFKGIVAELLKGLEPAGTIEEG